MIFILCDDDVWPCRCNRITNPKSRPTSAHDPLYPTSPHRRHRHQSPTPHPPAQTLFANFCPKSPKRLEALGSLHRRRPFRDRVTFALAVLADVAFRVFVVPFSLRMTSSHRHCHCCSSLRNFQPADPNSKTSISSSNANPSDCQVNRVYEILGKSRGAFGVAWKSVGSRRGGAARGCSRRGGQLLRIIRLVLSTHLKLFS